MPIRSLCKRFSIVIYAGLSLLEFYRRDDPLNPIGFPPTLAEDFVIAPSNATDTYYRSKGEGARNSLWERIAIIAYGPELLCVRDFSPAHTSVVLR